VMEMGLQRKVALGFMCAMLMSISLDFLSWRNKKAASDEADLVAHTYLVMRQLELTLGDVVDVETGARGFAATDQEPLLDPFNSGQLSLVQDLDSLRRLTASDPTQSTWLNPLTDRIKMAVSLSQEMVALRKVNHGPGAAEFQQGKTLVDAVRGAIRAQQNEQTRILNQRTGSTEAKRKQSTNIMHLSALLELTLLALAWITVSRALIASTRAQVQIENLNGALERRVADRTEQLLLANRSLQGEMAERRKAEEVRERFVALVESSEDAIVNKTLDGTITAWNPGAEKIFGYPAQEAVGKSISMLVPPERADEESEILGRIRRGERVEHFETTRIRKDGRTIDVSVTISPIRDSRGTIVGASKIATEITERKRAEAAVKESLATTTAALKELADQKFALDQHAIVAITDVQGTITYVNDKFCAISKYSKEELIGQNHRILNSGHHPREFFRQMYHAIAKGKVWRGEIKNRAKDGSIYWVDTTVVPFIGEEGKPRQYVAIRADITERKRVEEAMKESLATTEAALKELADQKFALDQHAIVAVTDVQGTITYVNDRFCAISQYSREELVGQNHRILNSGHHPKEFFQQMYRAIANGKVWRGEIKNRAKDASIYWVDTTVVPFVNATGKPEQYVAIRADITERKLAEQALADLNDDLEQRVMERTAQLQSANKELETFTYSVSHDLRAPLRHISGFSKILMEEFAASLAPEARRHLERIAEGARRMGLLVDELLRLAGIGRQDLRVQFVNLNELVVDVISVLSPDAEGRLTEWKIDNLGSISCDQVLIRQVFQNLIANALKFTRSRATGMIEIGRIDGAGESTFFVRDNGVGFDMKYADKLFGVFQRLHRVEDFEGTGIGLATVKRIVQKHGGRTWAEGVPGKGATFYFTAGRPVIVNTVPINEATGVQI